MGDMEEEIRKQLGEKRYREAFEMIVDRFQNKVFRLAYGMTREKSLAEETAQEAFLKVWKALPKYTGKASLSTWIYAITRNASIDAVRKRSARPEVPLDPPEPPGTFGSADGTASPLRRMMASEVNAMLNRLPENYRRVLFLFYLEEKSYNEVSEMLGLPVGTVKTHLHRAKKELASRIERDRKRAEKKRNSYHGVSGV